MFWAQSSPNIKFRFAGAVDHLLMAQRPGQAGPHNHARVAQRLYLLRAVGSDPAGHACSECNGEPDIRSFWALRLQLLCYLVLCVTDQISMTPGIILAI